MLRPGSRRTFIRIFFRPAGRFLLGVFYALPAASFRLPKKHRDILITDAYRILEKLLINGSFFIHISQKLVVNNRVFRTF
jgi:hypothetical protein